MSQLRRGPRCLTRHQGKDFGVEVCLQEKSLVDLKLGTQFFDGQLLRIFEVKELGFGAATAVPLRFVTLLVRSITGEKVM